MTKEFGPREKFFALNGLVCLAQSLEGQFTTVDLRNESSVYGKIEDVDVFMNISFSNAVFINGRGEKYKFDNFFIQARNVRYVHIPDQVPIIGAIEQQLGKILYPGRGKPSNEMRRTLKIKRALKNQKDTIALLENKAKERLKKEQEQKK